MRAEQCHHTRKVTIFQRWGANLSLSDFAIALGIAGATLTLMLLALGLLGHT